MRSLTIQIPQPCHERWDEMQPVERGRFCASCQKTVVDYTNRSDQELVKLLSQASETSCGRFRNEQLNRQLTVSNPGPSGWRHWIGLLTMGVLGWQTTRAQVSEAPKPSQQASTRPDFSVSTIPPRVVIIEEKKWVIQGRVMVMDSSGNLSPVAKANVSISQSGKAWQTLTDSTGSYNLEVAVLSQVTQLKVGVYSPDHRPRSSTVHLASSTSLITLEDIVLYSPMHRKDITGGGICIIRQPSLWQKIKRKLSH